MILWITRFVVSFLVNTDVTDAGCSKSCILFGVERLHLERKLREICSQMFDHFEIILPRTPAMVFSTHQQKMAKAELLNGFYFAINFCQCQSTTMNFVFLAESTIHATVGTDVGKIERKIELHGATKAFEGESVRFLRHRFEIGFRSRRNECKEIFDIAVFIAQRALHIGRCLRINVASYLFKIELT